MLEFDARIGGGEASVDACGSRVARVLPSSHRAGKSRLTFQAFVQALAGEDRAFDFGHVQPATRFGCMVDFQSFVVDFQSFG